MKQTITIKELDYLVTDDETITKEDEMIFEVRRRKESDATFVVGQWDDLLGSPKQNIENNLITPP
jgi:hypothetical protein